MHPDLFDPPVFVGSHAPGLVIAGVGDNWRFCFLFPNANSVGEFRISLDSRSGGVERACLCVQGVPNKGAWEFAS